ncbi:hypothetical protein [Mangrovimonas spongiae]|uniref:Uncharacterized protein n=1 Tax=Mangrovimonas spongiae TaxID=2494697 RepID=A0A428JY24_9FLAO|nr:hypothetical protein [Mangrovimonas spongiae]RSK39046.1 hypothetical protein EJA19_08885 [Mangrovimonas spongiae]
MNIIKKLFIKLGFGKNSKMIQTEFLELKSNLTSLEESIKTISEKKNSENIKTELSYIKTNFTSLECSIKNIENNNKINQNERKIIENELVKISQLLKPKKTITNEFKIIDTISNKSLFSFNKLNPTDNLSIKNSKIIDDKPNRILQAIGSIPEFLSGGLLANSYVFKFPSGIAGSVMQIGGGQGTAIMNGGQIVKHGAYFSNLLLAAPLLAYSAGNMIIKQHYLAKINANLEKIDRKLDTLIDFEFIKKNAEIEAMIIFFKRAFSEYDLMKDNENYRNAMLSNIISQNIKIYELIHFYKNALKKIEKDSTTEYQKNIKYYFSLQELFVFGKILEFNYANEYNPIIINNVISDFKEMKKDYSKIFASLLDNQDELFKINVDNFKWYDWFIGKEKKKDEIVDEIIIKYNYVYEIQKENNSNFDISIDLLKNLLSDIEKPKEFLIEKGKLYEINE